MFDRSEYIHKCSGIVFITHHLSNTDFNQLWIRRDSVFTHSRCLHLHVYSKYMKMHELFKTTLAVNTIRTVASLVLLVISSSSLVEQQQMRRDELNKCVCVCVMLQIILIMFMRVDSFDFCRCVLCQVLVKRRMKRYSNNRHECVGVASNLEL